MWEPGRGTREERDMGEGGNCRVRAEGEEERKLGEQNGEMEDWVRERKVVRDRVE